MCRLPEYHGGKQTARNLQRQATVDALTGFTTGHIFDLAGEALEQGKAKGLDFALLVVDVDHFKQVNDSMATLRRRRTERHCRYHKESFPQG
jgi:GGDEF domain-containing protein